MANDELDRLRRGIAGLPSKLAGVLFDHVLLELSISEIAERKGLSIPAVKSRTHRGRELLSRTLNPHRATMGAALLESD